MTNGKLYIPRLAMAVLVLGGACGDDSSKDNSSDDAAKARDGGAASERDAGDPQPESDAEAEDAGGAPPDAAPEQDAGVVGVDAAGPASTDVGDERLSEVARAFCAQAFACGADDAMQIFEDAEACSAEVELFWREDIDLGGDACGDAQLDLHACYAEASCEDQFTACAAEEELVSELCPHLDSSYSQ